jgi:hypothetical protein
MNRPLAFGNILGTFFELVKYLTCDDFLAKNTKSMADVPNHMQELPPMADWMVNIIEH